MYLWQKYTAERVILKQSLSHISNTSSRRILIQLHTSQYYDNLRFSVRFIGVKKLVCSIFKGEGSL